MMVSPLHRPWLTPRLLHTSGLCRTDAPAQSPPSSKGNIWPRRVSMIDFVGIVMIVGFVILSDVDLAFAPYGREPRLLVARGSRRAVVMPHLNEPGSAHVSAPGFEIKEAAIAVTAPAFLIMSSWV